MPSSCLQVAHSLNVKPHSACPQYVSHVEARVTVVRPSLSESCVIVTQREPALVVLVHMKHGLGDAPGSATAARSGLGDRGGGDSGCWFSMVRRRTARGGGIGGGRGGGRGGDGDCVADKDDSLSTALSYRCSSSANLNMC